MVEYATTAVYSAASASPNTPVASVRNCCGRNEESGGRVGNTRDAKAEVPVAGSRGEGKAKETLPT